MDVHAVGRDPGNVAVLEVDHLAGVGHDGGDVARDDDVLLADANHKGAALAGDDHLAGMLGRDEGDAVGAFDALQRLAGRGEEVALVEGRHQVRQDFGIGLRDELHAMLFKAGPQSGVVFDNAVVDERQRSAVGDVRVGVHRCGEAVGGPAGVRDAHRELPALLFRQLLFQKGVQLRHLAGLLEDLDAFFALQGDSSRIIAPVFQTTQPADQRSDRRRASRSKANYSAHVFFSSS